MKIKKEDLQKIPFLGTYIGTKEIASGSKSLIKLSQNKTHTVAIERFVNTAKTKHAKQRILRGIVSLFPFVGGALLSINDKCLKKEGHVFKIPFPHIFTEEKMDIKMMCAVLRSPTLIDDIFSTHAIEGRIDDMIRKDIVKNHEALEEAIAKIPETNDKKELQKLRRTWIKSLGKLDCDSLAKLNFTNKNMRYLGYKILEEAWIKSIQNASLGNARIEVTRHASGFSDISMAACFSVLAYYPKLKFKGNEVIKLIELKNSLDFSPHLSKSLANLFASNRKELWGFQLPRLSISAEQAKHFAKGLAYNNEIRFLELPGNQFGDEGVKAICESLRFALHSPRSKSFVLDVRGCELTDKSIPALYDLIKDCPDRVALYVKDNPISEEAFENFKQMIDQLNLKRPNEKKIELD